MYGNIIGKNMYVRKIEEQLGEAPIADYYGPPLPGQSFTQYESFMKMPYYTMGAAAIGALVAGPVGMIVGSIGGLFADSLASKSKTKNTTQGG